ncbi:MAG: sigma-70 family RNA polymerase sigma factor [Clostridia bacterium]|nr:sigma-70 family RNA polymerase sigma factor [Clostridia bacterium]
MDNGASSYRRFLDGDEGAFDEIMEVYRIPLTFFINRYVCDMWTAEDIAIDVFCYVLTHPRRYNFKASLKTYLFMLGRSRAIDHIRRRKRIEFTSLSQAERADDSFDPENMYLRDEEMRALHSALNKLPEDMRAVVHLVYLEGLSYAEAGRVLKKTSKHIDNLLYRSKAMLRTYLGKEGQIFYENKRSF